MRGKALEYLERDTLRNIDMIEGIRRGLGEIIYAGDDGVALVTDEGSCLMLACGSTELALSLAQAKEYGAVVIRDMAQKAALCEKCGLHAGEESRQFAYTGGALPEPAGCDIRRLGVEYTRFITETYSEHNEEYMEYLLTRGVLYGAFAGGRIAGFMGRHAEGSMGLLVVLPEYRRRGVAEALERRYVNMELDEGHVPYGQVFAGNTASMQLQKKLGMEFSDGLVCWLWKD